MRCEGCDETRTDILPVSVGITWLAAKPSLETVEVDVRASVFNLCPECRLSAKGALVSGIRNIIVGIRKARGGGT